ncbi:MAG: hypothetical protein ABI162_04930 [Luteolibacter sp.]
MKPASLFVIAPGLLGFLGMAALGWHLATPALSPATVQAAATGGAPRDYRHPPKSPRNGGIVAAQMRAIRNAGSPSERMRMAISLANSLPPSEFAAWMEGDRFDFRKGPEMSVFRMIVFERWIKEDPGSLIPWAATHNYGQAGRALLALANNNPQSLIDHYRSHPDDKTELQTLKEVAKKNPALALQRLQELSARGLPSGMARVAKSLLDELAKNSPAALKAAIASLAPHLQQEAERALSGQRLAASFPTEIRALWERPDGLKIFSDNLSGNSELSTKLIAEIPDLPESWRAGMANSPYNFVSEKNGKQWIEADLEGAGFSASQAKSIRERALLELASSDPGFALKNLAGSDVDSGTKADIISSALRSVKGDGVEAEKLIGMMNSEADRQLARDQLKREELAASAGKAQNPTEWLEKIGSINGALNSPYKVLDQIQSWDKSKIAELRARFNTLPVDQQQNIGRMVVTGGMNSEIDPGFAGDAVRSLVTHPPAVTSGSTYDTPAMASSTYAVKLSINDPAAATSWINTLPEGEAKLWTLKNVAANWRQYDPEAVALWVKTLPADARDQVTQYLQTPR